MPRPPIGVQVIKISMLLRWKHSGNLSARGGWAVDLIIHAGDWQVTERSNPPRCRVERLPRCHAERRRRLIGPTPVKVPAAIIDRAAPYSHASSHGDSSAHR